MREIENRINGIKSGVIGLLDRYRDWRWENDFNRPGAFRSRSHEQRHSEKTEKEIVARFKRLGV